MTEPAHLHDSVVLESQLASGSLAGSWTLDPTRSTATLRARHMWGLAPVNGQFRVLTGDGTVSGDGEIAGKVVIVTESVDTKNSQRDGHLRGADFFMTEKYPEITFRLDSLSRADQDVMISGMLTVRDISRRISVPAAVVSGDGELTFDATVEVDRSDYGMTVNHLGMVKMKCSATLHAVFTKS